MSNDDLSAKNEPLRETAQDIGEGIENCEQDDEKLRKQMKKEKRKKNAYKVLLLIAIIIIIILLLRGCSGQADYWWTPEREIPMGEDAQLPEIEDSALVDYPEEEVEVAETPHIDIPVIQSFIVSRDQPYRDLYNPETNADRYYLQYSFTKVGESEPFYESKLVEGGYQFSVDFGSLLEVGEHRVNVATNTFEYGSLAPKSGDMHEILITVTE